MSGKRDKGPAGNPWVNQPGPDEVQSDEPEEQLPPSPWNLEVQPPPSPWGGSAAPGPNPPNDPNGPGGPAGPGGPGSGPATQTSSSWGDKVGPPSLRRPPPQKKRPSIPPLLIPIGAGLLVVVIVAIVLVALSGGDDKAGPDNPPSTPVSTPAAPKTSYQPPSNAIPVGFGVSVVPAQGWTLYTKEKAGKQLAIYPPGSTGDAGAARAFFWVRQKRDVTANAYLMGIVEGETEKEITELGSVRNLPCPKDVLVECVAIDYTSTFTKNGAETKVKGSIEVYRRKDGVVTALDFRTNADFAPKAEADAATMKKSVIDSL
ncbi:hypothetical protein [Kribbella sp. NPDC051137]|uniref:hypothetical protein n=1 Tax=Kribbella sp. NPDC051137 TaxID=3155045 RepID=UPI002F8AE7E8